MSGVYQPDNESQISDFIKKSAKANHPIEVVGYNTKAIGRYIQCSQTLDLSRMKGVVEYMPEELYIKVRANTSMLEVMEVLKSKQQMLGFEPVDYGYLYYGKSNYGSVGGAIGCNLSGSRRFKAGALRDHLLGFRAVNGMGEIIKSGGTVVKNVTGYDLSKLVAGSYGTLSVLTEVVLKVLPDPEYSDTFVIYNLNISDAIKAFSKVMKTSLEISGACYFPKNNISFFRLNDLNNTHSVLALRVEGQKKSVIERIESLQSIFKEMKQTTILELYQSKLFWKIASNLECFSNSPNIVAKISLAPSDTDSFIKQFCEDSVLGINNKYFIDWAGGLVWMEIDNSDPSYLIIEKIKKFCLQKNAHMTIVKSNITYRSTGSFLTSSSSELKSLTSRIKKSFDPKSILNPGKMYAGI